MRIAIGSAKGSPGVTTLVQALASVWGTPRPLVVEFDPDGGDLAARLGLAPDPGLVSLASAGRRGVTDDLVRRHVQPWGSVDVLLAPPSATRAAAAITVLAAALGALDSDVIADCGRVTSGSPTLPWWRHADAAVIVLRPTGEEVAHAAASVELLGSVAVVPWVAIVGQPSPAQRHLYPAAAVAEALGVEILGVVPHDRRAADALAGRRPMPARSLGHSALFRSAVGMRQRLQHASSRTEAEPARDQPRRLRRIGVTP